MRGAVRRTWSGPAQDDVAEDRGRLGTAAILLDGPWQSPLDEHRRTGHRPPGRAPSAADRRPGRRGHPA